MSLEYFLKARLALRWMFIPLTRFLSGTVAFADYITYSGEGPKSDYASAFCNSRGWNDLFNLRRIGERGARYTILGATLPGDMSRAIPFHQYVEAPPLVSDVIPGILP